MINRLLSFEPLGGYRESSRHPGLTSPAPQGLFNAVFEDVSGEVWLAVDPDNPLVPTMWTSQAADRVTLERIAVASGVTAEWSDAKQCMEQFVDGSYVGVWDPRHDDGQALRLSVALRMNLYAGYGPGSTVEIPPAGDEGGLIAFVGRNKDMNTLRGSIWAAAVEYVKHE